MFLASIEEKIGADSSWNVRKTKFLILSFTIVHICYRVNNHLLTALSCYLLHKYSASGVFLDIRSIFGQKEWICY